MSCRATRLARAVFLALLVAAVVVPGAQAAVVYVTTTSDAAAVDGAISLREAIASVNGGADANADVTHTGTYGTDDGIGFDIAGLGAHTIAAAATPLPDLTRPTTIDGLTQPGAGGTPKVGVATPPLVARAALLIRGVHATLTLAAGSAGSNVYGNLLDALTIDSDNNGVGGTTPDRRNVIGTLTVTGSSNSVFGNYIGTNAQGTATDGDGVTLGGSGNALGSTAKGAGNLINGSKNPIVAVEGTANTVRSNGIGMDITGTRSLNVSGAGVALRGGGGHVLDADLISGAALDGVLVASPGNTISSTLVGTTGDGKGALGNGGAGIHVTAPGTQITNDLVAGNGGDGILIDAGIGGLTTIMDTSVGVGLDRVTPLGNAGNGIGAGSPATVGATKQPLPIIANNALWGIAGLGHFRDVIVTANGAGPFAPSDNSGTQTTMSPDGQSVTVTVTGLPAGTRVTAQAGVSAGCGGAYVPLSGANGEGTSDGGGTARFTIAYTAVLGGTNGLLVLVDGGTTVVSRPGCLQVPPGVLGFAGGPLLQTLVALDRPPAQSSASVGVSFLVTQPLTGSGVNATAAATLGARAVTPGALLTGGQVDIPALSPGNGFAAPLTGTIALGRRAVGLLDAYDVELVLPGGARQTARITVFAPSATLRRPATRAARRRDVLTGTFQREPDAARNALAPGASDPNAVTSVEVALARLPAKRRGARKIAAVVEGAAKGRRTKDCPSDVLADGALRSQVGTGKRSVTCTGLFWRNALIDAGKGTWRLPVTKGRPLKAGRYVAYVRALTRAGLGDPRIVDTGPPTRTAAQRLAFTIR